MKNRIKYRLFAILFYMAFFFIGLPGTGLSQEVRKDTVNLNKLRVLFDSTLLKLTTAAVICTPKSAPLIFPVVLHTGSILHEKDSFIVFGDYIYLKIDSIPALLAVADSVNKMKRDTLGDIILYINGNAMRDIGVFRIDRERSRLVFNLNRHSKYLMKFYPEFPYLWSKIPVIISAGFRNGTSLAVDNNANQFYLKFVSRWSIVFSLLFLLSVVVIFGVLAAKTNLIRIGDDKSPFSLALTQLSFWTIVIASSFIYIWIVTEEIPPLTGSTLILLSISAFTTAGSRLLDVREKGNSKATYTSQGFLKDILRDELGYSVHRTQMFMWTVIMGIIFVTSVIRFQQIPQLDESLLGLMGISSGAYVGLKTMENKPPSDSEKKEDQNAGQVTTT
jgi:hypothetical protein